LILLIERPVQKGDFVKVGDTVGTVDEIAMRATRVISRDGIAIIVPNSELITTTVVNQSAGTHKYRTRVKVGVSYNSDVNVVRDTLLEVARTHADVLAEPAPHVFFREFADSALTFELCVWLSDPQRDPFVTSDLRFAIDDAFRRRNIGIAFPQLEVHLRNDHRSVRPPSA
jgi:small-conductance mechanosensitive channel